MKRHRLLSKNLLLSTKNHCFITKYHNTMCGLDWCCKGGSQHLWYASNRGVSSSVFLAPSPSPAPSVGKPYFLVHRGSFVQWLLNPPQTFGIFLRLIFNGIMKFCNLAEILSKNSSYVIEGGQFCPLMKVLGFIEITQRIILLTNLIVICMMLNSMLPKLVLNKS